MTERRYATIEYKGTKVCNCTPAEAQTVETMLRVCNGSAMRVLSEYDYFTPTERMAFERIAMMQSEGCL